MKAAFALSFAFVRRVPCENPRSFFSSCFGRIRRIFTSAVPALCPRLCPDWRDSARLGAKSFQLFQPFRASRDMRRLPELGS
jgi:hypothetical protein